MRSPRKRQLYPSVSTFRHIYSTRLKARSCGMFVNPCRSIGSGFFRHLGAESTSSGCQDSPLPLAASATRAFLHCTDWGLLSLKALRISPILAITLALPKSSLRDNCTPQSPSFYHKTRDLPSHLGPTLAVVNPNFFFLSPLWPLHIWWAPISLFSWHPFMWEGTTFVKRAFIASSGRQFLKGLYTRKIQKGLASSGFSFGNCLHL